MLKSKLVLLALVVFCTTPAFSQTSVGANGTAGETTPLQCLKSEDHPRFLKLLEDAQLTQHLELRDVTFLVPSEEYFENLEPEQYQMMVKNPEALKQALQSHTLRGLHTGQALKAGMTVKTLTGESIESEYDDEEGLIVNGMVVVREDLLVGSGFIIHIVDDLFVELDDSGDTNGSLQEVDLDE
jgi:uncharacterized surface protein with fasciclin (FAS1) repeats